MRRLIVATKASNNIRRISFIKPPTASTRTNIILSKNNIIFHGSSNQLKRSFYNSSITSSKAAEKIQEQQQALNVLTNKPSSSSLSEKLQVNNNDLNDRIAFEKNQNNNEYNNNSTIKINSPSSSSSLLAKIQDLKEEKKLVNAFEALELLTKALKTEATTGTEIVSTATKEELLECFTKVFESLSQKSKGSTKERKESPLVAESLYSCLVEESSTFSNEEHVDMYNRTVCNGIGHVINTWCNSNTPNCGSEAESMLNELKEFCLVTNKSSTTKYEIPIEAYMSTILSYAREKNNGLSGHNAERVLRTMHEDHLNGISLSAPNAKLYTAVIGAYANTNTLDGAMQSERILTEMMSSANSNAQPDTFTITNVIKAWANSRTNDAGIKAESLLFEYLSRYDDIKEDDDILTKSLPDRVIFHAVMTAYSKQREDYNILHYEAGNNCEQLLRKMQKMYQRNPTLYAQVKPTTTTYNNVIQTYNMQSIHTKSNPDVVVKVVELFNEMLLESEKDGATMDIVPNTDTYNHVIRAVTKNTTYEDSSNSILIFKHVIDLLSSEASTATTPTDNSINNKQQTYDIIFDSLVKIGTDEALKYLTDLWFESKIHYPSQKSMKHIIYGLSISSTISDPGTKANSILLHLEQEYFNSQKENENGSSSITNLFLPTQDMYDDTITAFINEFEKSNENAKNKLLHDIEALLKRIKTKNTTNIFNSNEESDHDVIMLKPNNYRKLVHMLAMHGTWEAAVRAEMLLEELESYYNARDGEEEYIPSLKLYTNVINAFSKTCMDGCGARAHNILSYLEKLALLHLHKEQQPYHEQEYDTTTTYKKRKSFQLDTIIYNSVINAYANEPSKQSAKNAEKILRYMEQLASITKENITHNNNLNWNDYEDNINNIIQPNTISYTSVIEAYAKTNTLAGAFKAQELFNEMKSNVKALPNTWTVNTVIKAWANSANDNENKNENAGSKAEELLNQMKQGIFQTSRNQMNGGTSTTPIKPNLVSYNTVLLAYSNEGTLSSAQNAERILFRMEQDMSTSSSSSDNNTIIKPDTTSYNTVLNAYANTSSLEGAKRAEELLQRMKNDDTVLVEPSTMSYNIVLKAWAFSGIPNVGQKASEILTQNQALTPSSSPNSSIKVNTISLNTVMISYRNEKRQHYSGQKAEQVLRLMEELKQKGFEDMKPTAKSYNIVIESYINSKDVVKADQILMEVENLVKKNGSNTNSDDIRLDDIHMKQIIQAYIKTLRVEKADAILKRFETYYLLDNNILKEKPDQSCYYSITQAYKKQGNKKKANDVFNRMSTIFNED